MMLDILTGRKKKSSGHLHCPEIVGYVLQTSFLMDHLTVFCSYAPRLPPHRTSPVLLVHTPTIFFSGIVRNGK